MDNIIAAGLSLGQATESLAPHRPSTPSTRVHSRVGLRGRARAPPVPDMI